MLFRKSDPGYGAVWFLRGGSGIYTIDRKTLEIKLTQKRDNLDVDNGTCKLFNNSMNELLDTLKIMHKEKLKILKKNNKI